MGDFLRCDGPSSTTAVHRSYTVTIDNVSAARQVTNYLLDLGHRKIASITGPMHLTTGRGASTRCWRAWRHAVCHRSRVTSATDRSATTSPYSVARELLSSPSRPTAIYVANGVMALGVMRALADLGLSCPGDVSIASTDTIPGIGGLRPRLTRTEHPILNMTNEALRLLVDRIEHGPKGEPRNVVFQPSRILGESCGPLLGA